MRRSSRGNPWHDERGRFCSGPNGGGVIFSEKTQEEYDVRTQERMNAEDVHYVITKDGYTLTRGNEVCEGMLVEYAPEWRSEGEEKYIHLVKEYYTDGTGQTRALIATLNSNLSLGSTEVVTADMIQPASKEKVDAANLDMVKKNLKESQLKKSELDGKYGFKGTEVNGNTHFNLRGEASLDYIRCCGVGKREPFDKEKILPVKNREVGIRVKPQSGGVWVSPSNSSYGWVEWCEDNEMTDWNKNPEKLKIVGGKILHIYSKSDLDKLPHEKSPTGEYYLDFEKISEDYDALEVHISEGYELYDLLYSWDCDSTLVMNPDVIFVE